MVCCGRKPQGGGEGINRSYQYSIRASLKTLREIHDETYEPHIGTLGTARSSQGTEGTDPDSLDSARPLWRKDEDDEFRALSKKVERKFACINERVGGMSQSGRSSGRPLNVAQDSDIILRFEVNKDFEEIDRILGQMDRHLNSRRVLMQKLRPKAALSPEKRAEARKVFMAFDMDGSGGIDKNEMGSAMRSLGHKVTDEEAAQMIDKIDLDGNGQVEWNEFERLIEDRHKAAVKVKKKALAAGTLEELESEIRSKEDTVHDFRTGRTNLRKQLGWNVKEIRTKKIPLMSQDDEQLAREGIEEDTVLREKYAQIAQNEAELDSGWDEVIVVLEDLHQQARQIGDELDGQAIRLDNVETNVDDAIFEVNDLNLRLKKVTNDLSGQHVALNFICCALALALVGYLVFNILIKPTL